jgi:hypothetical protein
MVKGQKYHILYKITCTVTNDFYIGVHSTKNLDDGYLGSGKRIGYSVIKYGKQNHTKEILEFCESRQQLMAREREVVDVNLLLNPNCINLKPGGEGGFNNKEHQLNCSTAGGKRTAELIKTDEAYAKAHSIKMSVVNKQSYANGKCITTPDWTGKSHNSETKAKIGAANSKSQAGQRNSQFGTKWVSHPNKGAIKIKSDEVDLYLTGGYSLGRVIRNK